MKILVRDFIKQESSAGIVLIFVTIFALLLRNSPLSQLYNDLIHIQITVQIENIILDKPLYLWINDGLMAIFFLVIGLEIKREIVAGHLSSWSKIALPGIAAVGGMLIPALIFIAFNHSDSQAMRGWAIPTATDIAFALGILSLLGRRIPTTLKIFLMALAIIDDIGAIIIIALFYTSDLSALSLGIALVCFVILVAMNRLGVYKTAAYIIVGIVLWVSVLKSGVHATLAGIILAFTIPLDVHTKKGKHHSPARVLRRNLHFWVAFFVLPLFAFVNAGLDLRNIQMQSILEPVPLGIILGLFVGKQLGVFTFVFIAVKLGIAKLPKCSTWLQVYGVSVLTGIGFTMSLFIDSLAYSVDTMYMYTDRLGILIGSFISGILGYVILRFAKSKRYCKV
jgi:NhaA family Na+:H+ antiporter